MEVFGMIGKIKDPALKNMPGKIQTKMVQEIGSLLEAFHNPY
jgi:hypothetical protein